MIEVEDVTVRYEGLAALAGVDVHVEEGEFVTIIGPSGSGKTTLLRTIGGLEQPLEGAVRIDGRRPAAVQQSGDVGFVFQQHALLPWKTALDNVTFLRRMAGKSPAREDARALLETMGLEEFADARPPELSGGMKQRVAIARAVHLDADVLLMDEPFGELDELTREAMGVEVRRVWRRERKTVLFVTHSVPEAVLLGDRCLVFGDDPNRIETAMDVDLPRPRDETVFRSERFQRQVTTLRELLQDGANRT